MRGELISGKGLEKIESPRYIIFGPNALRRTAEILHSLGLTGTAVVVSGSSVTADVARDLIDMLEGDMKVYHVIARQGGIDDVLKVIKEGEERNADFLIGVGGGKPLDVTKLAAAKLGVRYAVVPTSASHDGIASPAVNFSLSRQAESRFGKIRELEAPTAVVADTKVINRAPPETFKSGFGDLVAKFTAVRDWELAHKLKDEPYSEYAASMSLLSAKIATDHASEIKSGLEESTRILVKALIGSGVAISIAGSSRPASGSEHMFSHALDAIAAEEGVKPAPHGIQVALGTIMMAYLQGQDWKWIREKLREAGVPTTAEEAGLRPDLVVKALTVAHKIRSRYTILGVTGLTPTAAEKLARATGVIR